MTSPAYVQRRRSIRAFSLIEVVMAIGVVAFALVAIASTLPVGLQSMRDSQNDQATATIENQLRGELQEISFVSTNAVSSCLTDLPGQKYYYTVEGVKTTSTSTTMLPYYQAAFAVTDAAVNGKAYDATTLTKPNNAAVVTITLTYPYPALSQSTTFSMFATKQTGK